MLVAFSWEIRPYLHQFDKAKLHILVALVLRSNERMRCWPSVDTLCSDTGYSKAPVIEAKQWLIQHGAIELVPYDKRVGVEQTLEPRHHIYQITGVINLDGKSIGYLVSGKDSQSIESKSSKTKRLDSEHKGIKDNKDNGSEENPLGSPKVEPNDGAENANDELDLYGIRIYDKNGKRLNSFQYIVAGINTHLFKGDNLGLAKKFASVLKENNFEPTGAEMQGYPIWYAALSPIDGEPREPIQSHLKFPSSWGEYIEWRKEHPDQAPEAAAAQGDTTSHEQRESAVPTIPTVLFAQMEDTYYDD